MIRKSDWSILRAFLEREAFMYRWKPETAHEHRTEFIEAMFSKLVNNVSSGYNYIHIQSITNMGLVDSELVLSGDPWDHKTDLYCLLPPSPRGGIGMSEREHGN